MPKELVYGRTNGTQPPVVHVGWGPRGAGDYVQLATLPPTSSDVDYDTCQYVDLDRDGINRLIRALRRARDRAYGADA